MPSISAFLEVLSGSSVIVDTPIQPIEEGARFDFVGEAAEIREAVDALPDPFEVEILRTGEYRPSAEQFSSLLTARQEEVLQTALDAGYYEMPRRSSQEAIAAELGITPETVNEHLRKIESSVLSKVLG